MIDEKSQLIPPSDSQSYSVFRMNISSICRMTSIFEHKKESLISNYSKLKQYNMHNEMVVSMAGQAEKMRRVRYCSQCIN